jgi:hypothetical protein
MIQPHDWNDLMTNAFHDELADETQLTDERLSPGPFSPGDQRRPTPLPPGGPAHPVFASPAIGSAVVAQGLVAADASAVSGGRGAKRWMCMCDQLPVRDCGGGRDCMNRILDLDEEKPATGSSGDGLAAAA